MSMNDEDDEWSTQDTRPIPKEWAAVQGPTGNFEHGWSGAAPASPTAPRLPESTHLDA
eukprot:SAG22_NODE_3637_length_1600_cov_4.650233_1_plen_57_part_10